MWCYSGTLLCSCLMASGQLLGEPTTRVYRFESFGDPCLMHASQAARDLYKSALDQNLETLYSYQRPGQPNMTALDKSVHRLNLNQMEELIVSKMHFPLQMRNLPEVMEEHLLDKIHKVGRLLGVVNASAVDIAFRLPINSEAMYDPRLVVFDARTDRDKRDWLQRAESRNPIKANLLDKIYWPLEIYITDYLTVAEKALIYDTKEFFGILGYPKVFVRDKVIYISDTNDTTHLVVRNEGDLNRFILGFLPVVRQ